MDREDGDALLRRMQEEAAKSAQSDESSGEDDTQTLREGTTRAIDADDLSKMRSERDLTQEDPRARLQAGIADGGVDPLDQPPDMRESVEVIDVAPDGTSIGRTLSSPTGEAIGGSGLSDSIQSRASELGGDALGRGIDFDPSAPGTNDSSPGGQETTGDPSVDRAIMGRDGSLMSAEPTPPPAAGGGGSTGDPAGPPSPPGAAPGAPSEPPGAFESLIDSVKDLFKPEPKVLTQFTGSEDNSLDYENPEGDTVDSETNLERVTVMQGSAVNPSTNPNDGGEGGSMDNYIPPADLETMPAQEGDVEATTLTSSATLGSSPVVNPTDPVLGDEGRMEGSYAGGGGGEVMPTSMTAGDASALGGEGEANLPITLEPAPAPAGMDAIAGKEDFNGVSVDMATGQVVGSAASAMGDELNRSGGMIGQGDEGDDDEGGVQSFGAADTGSTAGGSAATTFGTAAPLTDAALTAGGGGTVSQGDEGDDDEGGVQGFAGGDAATALGAPEGGLGGAELGGPGGLEGPPQMGEEGPLPGEEG